jgi:hypothetical protein
MVVMNINVSKIIIGFFVFVLGCKEKNIKIQSSEEKLVECPTNQRVFGDVSICLPQINGYIECYKDSLVQERAIEEIKILGGEILAVYLNNDLFSKFQKEPNSILWKEHIKVWGHPPLKNKEVSNNFLEKIESKIRKDSKIILIDDAIKKANKEKTGFNMEKPALIEIYKPTDRILSIVYLADYDFLGVSGKMLWIANMCILKKRLIYFGYYMEFDNKNAKEILKNKNLNFGREFTRLNE